MIVKSTILNITKKIVRKTLPLDVSFYVDKSKMLLLKSKFLEI